MGDKHLWKNEREKVKVAQIQMNEAMMNPRSETLLERVDRYKRVQEQKQNFINRKDK